MYNKSEKHLIKFSRELRNNMTEEESHLWYDFLKELPIPFKRQKIIHHYIVDFYCAKAKLVIELDGSQHYEEEAAQRDAIRDAELERQGFRVLRYGNDEIKKNFRGVCEHIYSHIEHLLEE